MAIVVYLCCALTSVLCAVMLLRGYRGHHVPLLLWSGLCFAALALENAVLFVDLIVLPAVDLSVVRSALGLLGPTLLVGGLIAESA
jgi:hypothetical protein